MRLAEYHHLIAQQFGTSKGSWISHSYVLPQLGGTPDELIEQGVDPEDVWLEICQEFEVPEHRRWGVDYSVEQ